MALNTGDSTLEPADLTHSPHSLSTVISWLKVQPSCLATSEAHHFAEAHLPAPGRAGGRFDRISVRVNDIHAELVSTDTTQASEMTMTSVGGAGRVLFFSRALICMS